MMTGKVGDKCRNSPWMELWSCPACYTDHKRMVTACAGCGTALRCTIEDEPVPVCTIVDPDDRDGQEEAA